MNLQRISNFALHHILSDAIEGAVAQYKDLRKYGISVLSVRQHSNDAN